MSEPGKEKVQFNVRQKETTVEKFKAVAYARHPSRPWGALEIELEKALLDYIGKYGARAPSARATLNIDGTMSPTDKAYYKVLDYIGKTFGINFENIWDDYNDDAKVPRQFLKEAIEHTIGNDKRTVRKWTDNFIKAKLVYHEIGFGSPLLHMRKPGYVAREEPEPKELSAEEQKVLDSLRK